MSYQIRFFSWLLVLLTSQSTFAQTITGVLAVTATVGSGGLTSTCAINTAAPLVFPPYFPFNQRPDDATSPIVITCSLGTPYNIGLNQGQGAGATINHRFMTKTASTTTGLLSYNLFLSADHTMLFGDMIGKNTRHLLGKGLAQTTTIYGEISAQQRIETGAYRDYITVTVTF